MNMYAHKLHAPSSDYIRYRGNTGQIDRKSTIIAILAKNPGLRGCDIANLIYNKTFMPLSHGKVYEVLREMCYGPEALITRSGNFYYLTSDAVSHDMAVTADVAERLGKAGVDLTKARFLSSGLLMFAEQVKAEAAGNNYDVRETSAVNLASEPDEPVIIFSDDDEPSSAELEIDLELEIDSLLENVNPFENIGEAERREIEDEVKQSFEAERQAKAKAAERAKIKNALSGITTAQSLLGKTVEINPGVGSGQLVGTILELRPTGVTFLITYSTVEGIEMGMVLPYEYSVGLTYKIVLDPDEFEDFDVNEYE
jgi:hypothetical protein